MSSANDLMNGIRSATITDLSILVREVRVKVGVLSKYVTVRIYQDPDETERFTFALSAVMKTAAGRGADDDDRTARTENEALRRAVRMLTQDYEDAVRRGEMPDDAWLVDSR